MRSEDEQRRDLAIDQYAASTAKLDARAALHARFSVATVPWHQWVLDQIALRGGETVVEVGAGTGLLWTANAGRLPVGTRLHLTDLSVAMCRRLLVDVPGCASVCRVDAERLPFRSGSADVVVANHMLYHVPDQRAALAEAARVLRPGGRAVFATNGRDHMKELGALLAAVGLPVPAADPTQHAFTLEDAQRIVAPVFPSADVRRFPDGLRVTEPDAVLAYIASFVPLSADHRAALRLEIDRRMVDGCLAITKAAGVVIVRARLVPDQGP